VKLVDANLLLYAVNESDDRHESARTWLDEALNGTETVGFTWIVVLAFLRLVTKVGLFPRPLPVPDAVAIMRAWLEQDTSVVVEPTPRHLDVLAGLLATVGTGGNLTSDAHLAAVALEHDATIVTYDTDFARFAGVSWFRPEAS
jgi:toxin-antitoxin system PIN domain toxin